MVATPTMATAAAAEASGSARMRSHNGIVAPVMRRSCQQLWHFSPSIMAPAPATTRQLAPAAADGSLLGTARAARLNPVSLHFD
jgi:hypothetical protein